MRGKQIERSPVATQKTKCICNVCGKPSKDTICETCSQRLRMEALVRKKHEEQGNAWSHWE